MKMKGKNNRPVFRVIEHTADIGIRVRGRTKKALFINAAGAMFALMARRRTLRPAGGKHTRQFTIRVRAENREELLAAWLSELLTLADIHRVIFFRFAILTLSDTSLSAKAAAEPGRPEFYEFKTGIKAVTYHQLRVAKTPRGFEAQVIFDA